LDANFRVHEQFYSCLVYADNIMRLSHSVNVMRLMLKGCDQFAFEYYVKFKSCKYVAMRIGARYDAV